MKDAKRLNLIIILKTKRPEYLSGCRSKTISQNKQDRFIQIEDLIKISSNGSMIEYLGHELNEESAKLLSAKVRQVYLSQHDRFIMLNLEQVKKIDLNAGIAIAELANIDVRAEYPYVLDNVFFGIEHLSKELAEIIAKYPSYFLHLDQIKSLPANVAKMFIGTKHALTFDGCSEFSPATLEALVKAASLLSLDLTNIDIEQAEVLSKFRGDLILHNMARCNPI